MSVAQPHPTPPRRPEHPVRFTVNDEHYSSDDHTLTPVQIMELAGVDPATNYLVEVKGRHQTSYRDHPNDEVPIHNGDKFVTLYTGGTPVS